MSYSWRTITPITYTGLSGTYITPQIMLDVLNNFQYLRQQLSTRGYAVVIEDNTADFNGYLTHPLVITDWVNCLKTNFKNLYNALQKTGVSPFAYEDYKEQTFISDGLTRVFNLNDEAVEIIEIKHINVVTNFTESNGIITIGNMVIKKNVPFTIKYYSFQRNFMLMTETEKLIKFGNIINYMNLIKNIADEVATKTAFLTDVNGEFITDINNKRITVYREEWLGGGVG